MLYHLAVGIVFNVDAIDNLRCIALLHRYCERRIVIALLQIIYG